MTRHCEVCDEVLTSTRPHARYCSPKCRQTASRSARSRPTRNPEDMSLMPSSENASSQVRDSGSVTPATGMSGPTEGVTAAPRADAFRQAATVNHATKAWPQLVVEGFRKAGLDEDAATWERHFRERGEWRE